MPVEHPDDLPGLIKESDSDGLASKTSIPMEKISWINLLVPLAVIVMIQNIYTDGEDQLDQSPPSVTGSDSNDSRYGPTDASPSLQVHGLGMGI